MVGVVAAIAMTAINILGIRTAARLQVMATTLILLVGVLLLGGGVANGDAGNMQPLITNGAKGFPGCHGDGAVHVRGLRRHSAVR